MHSFDSQKRPRFVTPSDFRRSRFDMYLVHQARLQLPRWILHKTWDFQFYRSYDGWRFQLKNWNIRSNDSPIFRHVEDGRTDLILELFDRSEASLYDVNEKGHTLIEVFSPSSCKTQN